MLRVPSHFVERLFLASVVLFLLTASLGTRVVFPTASRFLAGPFTEAGAVALYVSDIAFGLAIVVWLWARRRMPTSPLPRGMGVLLAMLVVWAFTRAASADDTVLGLYHALRIAQGVLIFRVAVDVVRWLPARALLVPLVVVGTAQGLLGSAQVARGASVGVPLLGESILRLDGAGVAKVDLTDGRKILRAYGTLPHPNILGGVLVATIVVTAVSQGLFEGLWRSLLYGVLAIQAAGLLLTFSRSALLSLLTITLLYFIIYFRKYYFPLVSVFSLFSGGLLVVLLGGSDVREALAQRIVPPPSDRFWEERVRLLTEGVWVFRENSLSGVGPGQFVPTIVREVPRGTSLEPWKYDYPHNVPLVVLAELGIIGAVLLASVLVELVRETRPKLLWGVTLAALMFPLVFDHYLWTVQQGRVLLWASFGVIAGAQLLRKVTAAHPAETMMRPASAAHA